MRRLQGRPTGRRGAAVLLGLLLLSQLPTVVWAAAPLGACCFRDGGCEDLVSFQCEGAGGTFIGDLTSCATVNCGAPVAAPLLSAAGMIAAVSAIAGVGAARAIARRRSSP